MDFSGLSDLLTSLFKAKTMAKDKSPTIVHVGATDPEGLFKTLGGPGVSPGDEEDTLSQLKNP